MVGPWLRYEDLTLTMAVVAVLWAMRRRRASLRVALAGGAAAGGVLCLSASSWAAVAAGFRAGEERDGGCERWIGGAAVAGPRRGDGCHGLRLYDGPLLAVTVALVWAAWREQPGMRRVIAGVTAVAAALHLVIGRFGWFYRYEVYIVLFATVVLLRLVMERLRVRAAVYVAGAVVMASVYLRGVARGAARGGGDLRAAGANAPFCDGVSITVRLQ